MLTPPVLVCRITWMDHYQGASEADASHGGGAFVRAKGYGHEAFNFAVHRGHYYGFVQPTGTGVNLSRLGAAPNADSISGVTVCWVATHPTEGGMRIVGWYRDATAYANYQDSPSEKRRLPDHGLAGYLLRASTATLLGRDARTYEVPRGTKTQSGMGQSNIWYPNDEYAKRLLAYLSRQESDAGPRERRRANVVRLQDVERRQRIERIAMQTTADWFTQHGYEVTDVAMQRLGWDLEARRRKGCLRIEVKGTSLGSNACAVDVSPNEYAKMRDPSLQDSYRLCIVSDAESTPTLYVFAWTPERGKWSTGDGKRWLSIEEITAARVRTVLK